MPANITETLKELTKDILTEESLAEIETAFNQAVEDRVQVHVEKALVEQDEDHATKVHQLLEAIDNDHTNKLERLVEAIDSDRSGKLKNIIMKYETIIGEEANGFKKDMISKVSDYLNIYLENAVPVESIKEAAQNKKSDKLLREMRKMLGVNMAVAQKSIRRAIVDGKDQIDESTAKLNEVIKENADLKKGLSVANAKLLLSSKTAEMSEDKKKHLYKIMNDKSPQFIAENFDYTSKLFDKSEEERLEDLTQQATRATANSVIDRPQEEEVIAESSEAPVNNDTQGWDDAPYRTDYMDELQKF